MPEEKLPLERKSMGSGASPETPVFVPEKESLPESSMAKEVPAPIESAEPALSETPSVPSRAKPVAAKSPLAENIENILAEDLTEVYRALSPQSQAVLKAKGEETATKIEKLLEAAKVNARKIVALIHKWLKLIPGVNRYFLEQESKIKADKILKLKE